MRMQPPTVGIHYDRRDTKDARLRHPFQQMLRSDFSTSENLPIEKEKSLLGRQAPRDGR